LALPLLGVKREDFGAFPPQRPGYANRGCRSGDGTA
jgi:hypothetical protein